MFEKLRLWPDAIRFLKTFRKMRRDKWSWVHNTRCKYIQLRIDMRSGRFLLFDQDGLRISLAQLAWQYSEKTKDPPKYEDD